MEIIRIRRNGCFALVHPEVALGGGNGGLSGSSHHRFTRKQGSRTDGNQQDEESSFIDHTFLQIHG